MAGLVQAITSWMTETDARREAGMTTFKEMTMATHKLLLLPGDGIGPEVMGEVKRLIDWLNAKGIAQFRDRAGPGRRLGL